MANPFTLSVIGNCGCTNSPCGAVCFSVNGCGTNQQSGVSVALSTGGAIASLTDVSHGTNYTAQPWATVSGDGCGASIGVNWTAPSTTTTAAPVTSDGGAVSGDAGSIISWTNPTNAEAADGNFSTATITSGEETHWFEALNTNSAFSVPAGASIDGFKLRIKGYQSSGSDGSYFIHVKMVIGGTITGTDQGGIANTLPATNSYTTFGSNSNLWGTTPTVAQVNATDFGVVFSVQDIDNSDQAVLDIDFPELTVYYTPSGGSQTSQTWGGTTTTGGISGFSVLKGGVGYTAATITIHRGVRDTTGSGASVTVASYSAITAVDSGTTNQRVFSVDLDHSGFTLLNGSGYTNGTGYALGISGGSPTTAATGTFDVVGGHVTNIQLTGHGDSYASAPTISFPGAGTPTVAASATATLFTGVCFGFSSAGTYALKSSKTGYEDTCSALPALCPAKYSLSAYDGLDATTLYATDNNGTWTLTGNSSTGWSGCATATFSNVISPDPSFCNGPGTLGTATVAFQYTFTCNPLKLTICALMLNPNFDPTSNFNRYGPIWYLVESDCSGSPPVSSICSDLQLTNCVGIYHAATSPARSVSASAGPPWTFTAPAGSACDSCLNTGSVVIST